MGGEPSAAAEAIEAIRADIAEDAYVFLDDDADHFVAEALLVAIAGTNLAEAAADFGEVEVGAYAAVVALAGLQLAGILLLHGFQAGLEAAGGSGPAHFSLWPLSFETAPEDGVLFTATVAWPALVGFPLLAFLVWSRAWRLLVGRLESVGLVRCAPIGPEGVGRWDRFRQATVESVRPYRAARTRRTSGCVH